MLLLLDGLRFVEERNGGISSSSFGRSLNELGSQ
jgi:hypothetical protein